jgi:uncharacterized delta-60 repeat protein
MRQRTEHVVRATATFPWAVAAAFLSAAAAIAIAFMLPSRADARPGALDPTFSGDGIAYTGFGPGGEDAGNAWGIAVQDDRKIVIAGNQQRNDNDVGLARFRPDGALDPSFGDAGTALIDFGSRFDYAADVAVDASGRIVFVGGISALDDQAAVGRLMPDGALDSSFGAGGTEVLSVAGPPPEQAQAYAVAIQPDGKIVIAGETYTGYPWRGPGFVARLKPDGDLDPGFGDGGVKTIDFHDFPGDSEVRDLVIDARGRIALAVTVARTRSTASNPHPAVARLTASGHYDRAFSGDGRKAFFDRAGDLNSIAATRGGGLVAGGAGIGGPLLVARFRPDGRLDDRFASDGIKLTDAHVRDLASGEVTAVALQSDGKVLLGAGLNRRTSQHPKRPAAIRLRRHGRLDRSFSGDGKTVLPIDTGSVLFADLALQPNGRILLAGPAIRPMGPEKGFVARLKNDGRPARG